MGVYFAVTDAAQLNSIQSDHCFTCPERPLTSIADLVCVCDLDIRCILQRCGIGARNHCLSWDMLRDPTADTDPASSSGIQACLGVRRWLLASVIPSRPCCLRGWLPLISISEDGQVSAGCI